MKSGGTEICRGAGTMVDTVGINHRPDRVNIVATIQDPDIMTTMARIVQGTNTTAADIKISHSPGIAHLLDGTTMILILATIMKLIDGPVITGETMTTIVTELDTVVSIVL